MKTKNKKPGEMDIALRLIRFRNEAPGILGIPFEEILKRYRRLQAGRSWEMQFNLKGEKNELQQHFSRDYQ